MCGIAGAVGAIDHEIIEGVRQMGVAQAHRGPDASGFWASNRTTSGKGAAFAFRRLAIIDLSEGGSQPMTDGETGNVIVFNGEIYNFEALRQELEANGERFRSRSDTEVILKAYARWGVECLPRLRGMFAFAIWDAAERSLLLARDRLGIKPLYLCGVSRPDGARTLLFASEVRALLATELPRREVDPVALASYVWNGFVVGPNTIVRGIELLPAGTSVVLSENATERGRRRYWQRPIGDTRPAARAELADELETAVRTHLVSDVPLGIFLSGGIDSSAVTALAVRSSNATVRTFTIGFDEVAYDESPYARAVASALGTEHQEIRLSRKMFERELPQALGSLDQPTFDGINTYFVSLVVRDAGLTVALAGTGGDEMFGGYRSFRDVPWAAWWSRRLSSVPREPLRAVATSAFAAIAPHGAVPAQTRWGKFGDVLATRGDLVDTYQVSSALFSSTFAGELMNPDV